MQDASLTTMMQQAKVRDRAWKLLAFGVAGCPGLVEAGMSKDLSNKSTAGVGKKKIFSCSVVLLGKLHAVFPVTTGRP